jgi:hypothetical protein
MPSGFNYHNTMDTIQMNNLTKEQKFIILWLYNRVARSMSSNPIKGGGDDIIVDGINVTETVRDLLKEKLFV